MESIEWEPIPGFEGLYEVSNRGEVKALERLVENNGGMQRRHEKILKQSVGKHGHCLVILCKNGKTYPRLVHRLVALAYIPNPYNKPVVDHIDTNPQNNAVDNLQWVTTKENANNPLTRQHLSQAKMGHPYYRSKPLSDEAREKIRQAHLGKKLSKQHRANLSKALKNSEKARSASMRNLKKATAANLGKPRPDDVKRKIGEAHKGLFKNKTWKIVDGKRVWMEREESKYVFA